MTPMKKFHAVIKIIEADLLKSDHSVIQGPFDLSLGIECDGCCDS